MVPLKFIIPSDQSRWPEMCWGIRLGELVRGLKNGDNPISEDQKMALRIMGLKIDQNSHKKASSEKNRGRAGSGSGSGSVMGLGYGAKLRDEEVVDVLTAIDNEIELSVRVREGLEHSQTSHSLTG